MPAPAVPDAWVALAHRLADASGSVIRQHFRSPIAIETKPDDSPVTEADKAAESAIRTILVAELPGHGIHGEEHGAEGIDRAWVWVIDPIDGTKSFICGMPTFGTLIALMHEGTPVLGVIDQPVQGERWIGVTGRPTVYRDRTGTDRVCRTRACPTLERATVMATSPDMFVGRDADAFARLRDSVHLARYGADCYAYGVLAMGFVDLACEASMHLHDYAALVPVVEGAGGRVTDWAGNGLGMEADGRIIAAGDPALHAAAIRALAG